MDSEGCRNLALVLCTHKHEDHIGGVQQVLDWHRQHGAGGTLDIWKGAPAGEKEAEEGFRTIRDGDVFRAGGAVLRALQTPGHTDDHFCFLLHSEGPEGDHESDSLEVANDIAQPSALTPAATGLQPHGQGAPTLGTATFPYRLGGAAAGAGAVAREGEQGAAGAGLGPHSSPSAAPSPPPHLVFTGDCVLGCGSTVFDDLSTYMASLRRLLAVVTATASNSTTANNSTPTTGSCTRNSNSDSDSAISRMPGSIDRGVVTAGRGANGGGGGSGGGGGAAAVAAAPAGSAADADVSSTNAGVDGGATDSNTSTPGQKGAVGSSTPGVVIHPGGSTSRGDVGSGTTSAGTGPGLEQARCVLFPGHGPVVPDGLARIHEYIAHREERERQIVAVLARAQNSKGSLPPVGQVAGDVLKSASGDGSARTAGARASRTAGVVTSGESGRAKEVVDGGHSKVVVGGSGGATEEGRATGEGGPVVVDDLADGESEDDGWQSVWQIVSVLYADVPKVMWPAACHSVQLHLDKLEVEGRVKRSHGRLGWRGWVLGTRLYALR
eukprot:jgi/Mesvir1/17099/Mv07535-RA.2